MHPGTFNLLSLRRAVIDGEWLPYDRYDRRDHWDRTEVYKTTEIVGHTHMLNSNVTKLNRCRMKHGLGVWARLDFRRTVISRTAAGNRAEVWAGIMRLTVVSVCFSQTGDAKGRAKQSSVWEEALLPTTVQFCWFFFCPGQCIPSGVSWASSGSVKGNGNH